MLKYQYSTKNAASDDIIVQIEEIYGDNYHECGHSGIEPVFALIEDLFHLRIDVDGHFMPYHEGV